MANTTWTQVAGMDSTDEEVLIDYADNAEQSSEEAAASAAAAAASAASALSSEESAGLSETAAAGSASSASASAATATTKASEASTSAASAASSASTATTEAANAATSASNAASSEAAVASDAAAAEAAKLAAQTAQTAAETAETNAETAETNAAASEAAASSSATSASSSAATATTKASEASTSATNAASSATAASTSETNAASSASAASTSASNASSSATAADSSAIAAAASETASAASESAAATSASNAATSESNAASSASAAFSSETNAATSETNAANSATNSATSATSAAGSATTAATKASEASASASAAATSETNAATSETNAASSASAASTSETNAAASEAAAAASYDNFDDRYLGAKASDPALDNDGDALLTGALFYNTTTNVMKVYDGAAWVAAYSSIAGITLDDVTSDGNTTANSITVGGITATGPVILNADPSSNLGAATKQYVDTIAAAGLHYHDPVRVEKEGNLTATYDNGTSGVGATLTNSGTQEALVIDDVTLSIGDRVLIYEQTNQAHNGVYTVTDTGSASTNWVLTRATDADSYSPSDPDSFGQGDAFYVQEGTMGAGELYVMTTEGTITFGTTNIHFSQISSAQVYSGGTGIDVTGTTISSTATLDNVTTNNNSTTNAITVGGVTSTGSVTAPNLNTGNWDTAYSWGNHASVGYLTGFTETDPTVPAHVKSITTTEKSNWNTAYGWGNHAVAGYLPSSSYTAADVLTKVKTVDGAGSGLDADTLDGQQGSYYYPASNPNGYTDDQTASEILTAVKTVDGSGSGLDADLLDGLQPSQLSVNYASTAGSADNIDGWGFTNTGSNNSVNADTINSNGISYYGAGVTNFSGNASDGALYSQAYSTSWQHQIAGDYRSGQIALRGKNNGTWQAWRKVWDESNDGSGSGLDADLLDGYNASASATASTVVVRDGSGHLSGNYIFGSYFNASAGSSENPTIGQIWTQNTSDNYLRKSTPSHFRSQLGLWWSGNDGSGSGLDADLLDGQQPSALSVNYANTAGSAPANGGTATALNSSNYISRSGSSGNYNTDFSNTPAGSVRHQGDDANATNNPGGAWWFLDNYRHSNGGNYWGTQVAWGWEDNANTLRQRNITAGSYSGWVSYWNTNNDGSGSGLDADLLDGHQGDTYLGRFGNTYYQTNTWIQLNGEYGLYCPSINGAHFYPNTAGSYGTWRIDGVRSGYTGIYLNNGGGVVTGMYDSGGNGGEYSAGATGGWHYYYHRGNRCMAVGGSSTSSAYGIYEQGGGIYSTGNITAYSDRRVKENIRTIDNALETVEQMRGVYYNRIDDEEKKTVIGFIAQEVDEIEGAKPLVTYAEDVDQYGVSYGNTTALLVEAIKELSQQVKELQQEIKELKNA